jgi:hypothetical protein
MQRHYKAGMYACRLPGCGDKTPFRTAESSDWNSPRARPEAGIVRLIVQTKKCASLAVPRSVRAESGCGEAAGSLNSAGAGQFREKTDDQ